MNFNLTNGFIPACIIILFSGCGVPLKFQTGLNLIDSGKFPQSNPPQQLQAKVKTTAYHEGNKTGFTTLISAIPEERYRLEFKGPLGNHMGDFYWVKDSIWVLSVPAEQLFIEGRDSSLQLPYLSLDSLDINFMFGFLWGQITAPGNYSFQKKSAKTIQGLHPDNIHSVVVDSRSGQILISREGKYWVEYSKYKMLEGAPYPSKIKLFREKVPLLEMEIKKINNQPAWKKSPFYLNFPD